MNTATLDFTLKELRLSGLGQSLPARLQEAAANQLTHADVKAVHPAYAADWNEVFDLRRALARREGTGMPGPRQVARQFARWRKELA